MDKIKYFVMDVDGTLTDGKIYMSPHGEAMKAFNIKDGCGIQDLLIPTGILPVIITGRTSDIVENRCREIGINEVYQGIRDKLTKLVDITDSNLGAVAYIGDDINDLPCVIKIVESGGLVGCPADAVEAIIRLSHFIAPHNGGEGAVRDFIEWLIKQ